MSESLSSVVTEFLLDCEARGHSPRTLLAYGSAFKFFLTWTTERQAESLTELTPPLLREYALHCSELLSPGGAHARLRPIKSLVKWAYHEELLSRDLSSRIPMPRLKRERLPAVRLADFQKLTAAARVSSRSPLRDVALLTVLFDTGLRASEALSLQLEDVRSEGFLVVRQGKGGKTRTVPMDRKTLKAIRSYVRKERPQEADESMLFLGVEQGLTRGGLDKLLERLCKVAGLPRLSAHAFRRGCAVQFLRNGGDAIALQHIFGHTSLEMTSRYAQLIDDDLKLAHRRASPLRKVEASN